MQRLRGKLTYSNAEWEEGSEGNSSEYSAHLEEAVPGELNLVVSKISGVARVEQRPSGPLPALSRPGRSDGPGGGSR
jgi:hypothetical protein